MGGFRRSAAPCSLAATQETERQSSQWFSRPGMSFHTSHLRYPEISSLENSAVICDAKSRSRPCRDSPQTVMCPCSALLVRNRERTKDFHQLES